MTIFFYFLPDFDSATYFVKILSLRSFLIAIQPIMSKTFQKVISYPYLFISFYNRKGSRIVSKSLYL